MERKQSLAGREKYRANLGDVGRGAPCWRQQYLEVSGVMFIIPNNDIFYF